MNKSVLCSLLLYKIFDIQGSYLQSSQFAGYLLNTVLPPHKKPSQDERRQM